MFPKIDFTFSGYVVGATIEKVYVTETGNELSTDGIDAETLINNLQSGEWVISLADAYNNCRDGSAEFDDYDESV